MSLQKILNKGKNAFFCAGLSAYLLGSSGCSLMFAKGPSPEDVNSSNAYEMANIPCGDGIALGVLDAIFGTLEAMLGAIVEKNGGEGAYLFIGSGVFGISSFYGFMDSAFCKDAQKKARSLLRSTPPSYERREEKREYRPQYKKGFLNLPEKIDSNEAYNDLLIRNPKTVQRYSLVKGTNSDKDREVSLLKAVR